MKKKNIISAVLLTAAISVSLFSGCAKTAGPASQLPVTTAPTEAQSENLRPAPDFTVRLTDGSTFTLSEARGKAVILNIWATWCGPCCRELPAFQELYDEFGGSLQVLAVNYAESEKTVRDFIEENGYTFPFALDEYASVSALYPSDGIPFTVIIDPDGNISQTFTGARSAEEQYVLYKAAVEEVLNEK